MTPRKDETGAAKSMTPSRHVGRPRISISDSNDDQFLQENGLPVNSRKFFGKFDNLSRHASRDQNASDMKIGGAHERRYSQNTRPYTANPFHKTKMQQVDVGLFLKENKSYKDLKDIARQYAEHRIQEENLETDQSGRDTEKDPKVVLHLDASQKTIETAADPALRKQFVFPKQKERPQSSNIYKNQYKSKDNLRPSSGVSRLSFARNSAEKTGGGISQFINSKK